MKTITLFICSFALIAVVAGRARSAGAQQTWTGEISDSHCHAEHEPLAEGDPVLPSPECVRICLTSGFKYVFVVGDKVYSIANQTFADLSKFAGQPVKLSGDLKGETITVAKIE